MVDRSVRVVLDAAVGGFVTGMGSAAQSAVGFAKTAGAAIDSQTTAMNKLASTSFKVGLGLTAIAGFAVKSAMDWESAWTGVLKTVSGTPAQLAQVEQGLRDLATSMPESHQEIAAVAEAAGQLGIARQDIVAFTRTMVMLGDTTNLTADEAATSMAQFMNIMGTAPHQVDNLGAALVNLGNNGASTERQILEMAQRIAGAGRIVGLSEADVLGLSSAVASTGIEVEAGGTAISQTLISISKAVATGSGALGIFAKTAGMSAKEFADAWRTDPAQAFLAFEQGLNTLGQDAFKVLDQLGLDGARVGRVLLNLAGANELLAQSFQDSNTGMAENTALLNEAEKRYDTAAAKATIAWNQIKDAAIDAGQSLLPVVAGIAGAVGGVADAFSGLPGPIKSGLTTLTAFAGASLLAIAAMIKIAQAARNARIAMGGLGGAGGGGAGGGAVLGGFSRGAIGATTAVLALSAAVNAFSSTSPATVRQWTGAFLDLAKAGKAGQSIDGVRAKLEDLVNVRFEKDTFKNLFQDMNVGGFGKALGGLEGAVGLDPFKSSRDSIAAMDDALAGLVDSGHIDEAKTGFKFLAEEAKKQGVDIGELTAMFPGYTAALGDVGRESANAANGFREAAGGSAALAMRLAELSADPAKAQEALAKLRQETQDSARAFSDFTANLDDTHQSFADWMKDTLKGQKAAADFDANLIKLAARGLPAQWLADLEAQGPKAASLVEELADSSDKDLGRMIDAFNNAGVAASHVLDDIPTSVITQFDIKGDKNAISKVAKLAAKYNLTPEQVETIMRALDFASGDIKAVLALMEKADRAKAEAEVKVKDAATKIIKGALKLLSVFDGKHSSATITTHYRTVHDPPGHKAPGNLSYAGGRVKSGFAGGGVVPGDPPANPFEDNVLAIGDTGAVMSVRSREWIVNQKSSDENDNWLRAVNNGLNLNKVFGPPPGFARGGVNSGWDRAFTAQGRGRAAPGGPTIVSTDLAGVEIGMDSSGVYRIVRGEVRTMLAEAGREGNQRFQSAVRRG